jgi:phage terminase large subunit-like protein
MASTVRLPPGCGRLLEEPLLYNEYQQRFTRARRQRFCLNCRTMGMMDEVGSFVCSNCQKVHNGKWGNLTAPRMYDTFLLLAGRGGGKTLGGAHAVREELMIPGAEWWVAGATYKLLWDSTFPTLVGLLHPQWIERWDAEHAEIILKNKSKIAFRSLEDPDRMRGPHGVNGMWIDEAAQSPKRAWEVGSPMLIKAGGIRLATTTVLGFDWTYEEIERRALVYRERGFWAAKWKTVENPLFLSNPVMKAKIERDRKMMTPALFAQEYESERSNAEGLIYGEQVGSNYLANDDEVRRYIPEWPNISPRRKVLIGVDEGGDHPFGVVLIVVTEKGLVVVADYLKRMKANSAAHDDVHRELGLHRFPERTYAANKNALQLRLEWGLKGTGVIQAESKQEVGIQRVQSWLLTRQLKFAYTAQRTKEQMMAYRYADNTKPSTGEKKEKEGVFKLKDELCDAVRYALMAWPELPDPEMAERTPAEQARWEAFDDKTRWELERMKELTKAKTNKGVELSPHEDGYPSGNIFQHEDDGFGGMFEGGS